jgi:hypothetical protein
MHHQISPPTVPQLQPRPARLRNEKAYRSSPKQYEAQVKMGVDSSAEVRLPQISMKNAPRNPDQLIRPEIQLQEESQSPPTCSMSPVRPLGKPSGRRSLIRQRSVVKAPVQLLLVSDVSELYKDDGAFDMLKIKWKYNIDVDHESDFRGRTSWRFIARGACSTNTGCGSSSRCTSMGSGRNR